MSAEQYLIGGFFTGVLVWKHIPKIDAGLIYCVIVWPLTLFFIGLIYLVKCFRMAKGGVSE